MADDIDRAQAHTERELTAQLDAARGFELAKGKPGDCDYCGEWSGRLVKGACAPCRDKYGLE